jgi:hypothetical protein
LALWSKLFPFIRKAVHESTHQGVWHSSEGQDPILTPTIPLPSPALAQKPKSEDLLPSFKMKKKLGDSAMTEVLEISLFV